MTRLERRNQEISAIEELSMNKEPVSRDIGRTKREIEKTEKMLKTLGNIAALQFCRVEIKHSHFTETRITTLVGTGEITIWTCIKDATITSLIQFWADYLIELKRELKYWESPPETFADLQAQGRLYYRNSRGQIKKL